MKRFKVIILMSVIVVSLVVLSWNLTSKLFNNTKMLAQDEIIEIFEQNKDHFENIKKSMSDFNFDWSISKNRNIGSGWKTCVIKGNLYLGIRLKENFHQLDILKKTIKKEESIVYLLKKSGFKNIQYNYHRDSEYIDFTKQASLGDVAGILCCIKGNIENHPYAKNITDLGDGWYYYGSR